MTTNYYGDELGRVLGALALAIDDVEGQRALAAVAHLAQPKPSGRFRLWESEQLAGVLGALAQARPVPQFVGGLALIGQALNVPVAMPAAMLSGGAM